MKRYHQSAREGRSEEGGKGRGRQCSLEKSFGFEKVFAERLWVCSLDPSCGNSWCGRCALSARQMRGSDGSNRKRIPSIAVWTLALVTTGSLDLHGEI
jgi:hypothetical protein